MTHQDSDSRQMLLGYNDRTGRAIVAPIGSTIPAPARPNPARILAIAAVAPIMAVAAMVADVTGWWPLYAALPAGAIAMVVLATAEIRRVSRIHQERMRGIRLGLRSQE